MKTNGTRFQWLQSQKHMEMATSTTTHLYTSGPIAQWRRREMIQKRPGSIIWKSTKWRSTRSATHRQPGLGKKFLFQEISFNYFFLGKEKKRNLFFQHHSEKKRKEIFFSGTPGKEKKRNILFQDCWKKEFFQEISFYFLFLGKGKKEILLINFISFFFYYIIILFSFVQFVLFNIQVADINNIKTMQTFTKLIVWLLFRSKHFYF